MRTSKKTSGKWIAVLVTVLLIAAGNHLLSLGLIPDDITRVKVHHAENAEEDILILGTSHGAAAFDPEVIEDVTGRSCYNAAAGGLYPKDNYYILLDALRNGKPETVVLEYDPSYWTDEDGGSPNEHTALSAMAFSPVKVRAMADALWKRDFRYAVMPWYMHRSEITRFRANLERKQSEAYRDYLPEGFFEGDEGIHLSPDGQLKVPGEYQEGEIPEYGHFEGGSIASNLRYFEKILKLCQSSGIRAVVVMTPVPEETEQSCSVFYEEASALMRKTVEAYGAEYFDYVTEEDTRNSLPEHAFYDFEGHMHEEGAAAFSADFASGLIS